MALRFVLFLLCSWLPISLLAEMPELGPLANYVAKKDDSYRWNKIREGRVGSSEYAELILTSQTWRDIVWKHQLFVLRPSTLAPDTRHAMLFIAGGRWREELEKADQPANMPREATVFAALAEQLKAPIAVLLHVPQQPIFGGKVEDQIIAYTFSEFMKTKDPEWPLLLPMVKSAVRGMDAVQEFAARDWSVKIDSFTVTGGSKRGWTTWLTGAVDQRAVALAPMVIDVLNMAEQMRHQKDTWGTTSEQIADYSERGLTDQIESPEAHKLREIIDPYSYRSRLTQPKLIILGTNDRYWPLDALNLYWDGLSGDKYVMYVPNNGHGVNDIARLSGSLAALHLRMAAGRALPKLSWEFAQENNELTLRIKSDLKPIQVDTWIANSETKDFRNSKWSARPARKDGEGFICRLPRPESGYSAMFGELVFDGQSLPYFLSTNVRILGGATGE